MNQAAEQLVARSALLVLMLSATIVGVSSVFAVLNVVESSQPLQDIVSNSLVFGLFGSIGFLLGSARIEFTNESIRLVQLLVIYDIPTDEIMQISADRGFELVLRDGSRMPSIVFGRSVVGNFTGYRRASRFAAECNARLKALDAVDQPVNAHSNRPRLRKALLLGVPSLLGWYVLLAVVAFNVR